MRDDELRRWLRERNPWWRSAAPGANRLAWTQSDPSLRAAESLGIDYRPPILSDIEDGGLYVIRGPRRVGKSVALKRHIADLLTDPNVHPSQVIYLTLDEFDPRSLRRALRLGRELTFAAGDRHRYWLIDEVTSVPGWPAIFKSARDDTSLAYDTVILTGSSAHGLSDARRALGAGRVGMATEPFRLLLPMTFRSFLHAMNYELPELPLIGASLTQDRLLRSALTETSPFVDEFDLAWQAYCEIGGFPRAVGEYRRDGAISSAFANDLMSWLSPDVTPEDPPESILRLLQVLADRMTSPLNVRGTAEVMGMTRERFVTRLNRLQSTFAAIACPQVDNIGTPLSGAQSKYYLLDPIIAVLPTLVEPLGLAADMSAVSEAALATTVARSMDAVHSGRLIEGRAVGYQRTSSGVEIDFAPLPIHIDGVSTTTPPIESKWVTDGWRPGARALEGSHGTGFIATKNILDLNHPSWAVPAGVLAMLLA